MMSDESIKVTDLDTSNRSLLESAWIRYKVYSDNATASQYRFVTLRKWISGLNVFTIFLAILHSHLVEQSTQLPASNTDYQDIQILNFLSSENLFSTLQQSSSLSTDPISQLLSGIEICLIILPIVITVLLVFSIKFDKGNNWILLRGSAESIKMAIFYYRARVDEYSQDRNSVLAHKIKTISERLRGSAVHQASLKPFESEINSFKHPKSTVWETGLIIKLIKNICTRIKSLTKKVSEILFGATRRVENVISDNKYSDLNPEQYLTFRLENQFDWYRTKTRGLDRQLHLFQSGVYIFGGLGTFLAAIGFENWVAVTIAVTGALTNYLEFKRVEATLVGYNQAADALYDIRTWWLSRSERERENPELFSLLVKNTEETIRSEHVSWLQDMQERLSELYGQTEVHHKKAENFEPVENSEG